MKHSFILFAACLSSSYLVAQRLDPTPKQIEEQKQFEKAKQEFLDGQYDNFLSYYDSIINENPSTRLDAYKMANESHLQLAKANGTDSLTHFHGAQQAYELAIKWHGRMYVEEKWESTKIEVSGEPEVFKIVDQQPEFPGGMSALYKFIGQEMSYPEEARRMGIQGKVYVQFIVNKDGSVDAVNAFKAIGGGCEEEAVRVVKSLPNFSPGMQDGKPVYVRMILPMTFKLSGAPEKKKKKKSKA